MTRPQYDTIAADYLAYVNASPTRAAEYRMMRGLAGDLRGARVLDLACGSGYYGRRFLEEGAASSHGVDQSPVMIEQARAISHALGDNATFQASDVLELSGDTGEFDLVVAAFLFNYAQSLQQLDDMAAKVRRHVAPGGRLVLETINPDYRLALGDFSRYGITVQSEVPWQEGACITMAVPGSPPAQLTVYRWERAHYEAAFQRAGFSNIRWQAAELIPDDFIDRPTGFWDELVRNNLAIWLACDG
ncbi:class I SAM-dependent methyltransferase [Xanthomonas sp. 60]